MFLTRKIASKDYQIQFDFFPARSSKEKHEERLDQLRKYFLSSSCLQVIKLKIFGDKVLNWSAKKKSLLLISGKLVTTSLSTSRYFLKGDLI